MAAYFGKNYLLYPTFESSYETAHEYLYHKHSDHTIAVKNYMPNINKTVSLCNHSEYCDAIVDEFVKRIGYESKNVKVVFDADTSCLYQPNADRSFFTIRGYMSVYGVAKSYKEYTNEERNLLDNIKFTRVSQSEYEYYPVDVHVRREGDGVVIWRIVRLDESVFIAR